MKYKFPIITHVSQVLDAIKGRDEFVVKNDAENGYTVVNYLVNFEDTFPEVETVRHAILRECRGITFSNDTGKVISRKYHKFFNLGEKKETQAEWIDWSIPYRRFEKLDGSMITPLIINDDVRWATKMGLTEVAKPVDQFTSDKENYLEFVRHWVGRDFTPIFEWCSRQQRIVIDYPDDQLVLTAIRNNVTGEYMDYDMLKNTTSEFNIDLVRASEVMKGFNEEAIADIRNLKDREGDVWRNENGHMIKLKGDHYCQLHKTLDHLNFEKDVIRLILDEKLDDVKSNLPKDLMDIADKFASEIFHGLRKNSSDLFWEVRADYDNLNGSKKKFASKNVHDKVNMSIKFTIWDKIDNDESFDEEGVYKILVNLVKANLNTQTKVNNIRRLWGDANWYNLRSNSSE